MSASSSTMRMSCAMTDRTQLCGRRGSRDAADSRVIAGKHQPHTGAAILPIRQHQLAMMIFHDLLDDGETQAGAFRPSRNIGFGQAFATVRWQALAVVFDGDRDLTVSLNRDDD